MITVYKKLKNVFWGAIMNIHPGLHAGVFRFRMFIKYIFSGSMGAIANLGSLAFFVEVLGFHYLPASMLAFLLGFATSFVLQKFFTFGNTAVKALHRQLAVYFFIALVNLGLNTLLVFVLTEKVGFWYFLSQLTAGACIALWSFFLYRTFVFHRDVRRPLSRYVIFTLLVLALLVGALYIPSFIHTRTLSSVQEDKGFTPLPVYGSDSVGFASLADTLLEHGNLGYKPGEFDTFRTPGYPLLLAGWKGMFGSYDYFPLFQIVLVYLTSLLIFCIGNRLFSVHVGALAAGLFVLNPNVLYHSLTLLSEIPHVFLLSLSVFLVIVRPRMPIHPVFAAGLVLGFATLIKPVSLYLPVAVALYSVAENVPQNDWKKILSRSALTVATFTLAFVAVLLPWLLRNYRVAGVAGISSVSAFNLFHYTVPEFLSFKEGITPDQGREKLQKEISFSPSEIGELRRSSEIQRVALSYISDDPVRFVYFYTVKSAPFFLSSSLDNLFVTYNDVRGEQVFSPSTANLTNFLLTGDVKSILRELKAHPSVAAEQAGLAFLFAFAFIGLIFHWRKPGAWLLFLSVGYFAAVTGVVAYARLRIPAEPFLFLLASAGFSASMGLLWPRKQGKKSSPLLFPHITKSEL